jgi:hypothetical protein
VSGVPSREQPSFLRKLGIWAKARKSRAKRPALFASATDCEGVRKPCARVRARTV